VFFLVCLKFYHYYSRSVEIMQKPPISPLVGFPRALYRNSAQIRKNSPIRRRPSKYPWGGTTKKRQAGHFKEAFLGGRGGGRRGKNTQEKTTAAHAPPHVGNAGQRVQRGPALRTHQAQASLRAQADTEGHGAPQRCAGSTSFSDGLQLKLLPARRRP
jgi:hypothetical protein